jgi:HTH-type transcriptional repressor of NAD biosynthesis genes
MEKPVARGLLLGKFLPPHRGHQYLIDFARNCCRQVTVLVCSRPQDPIPGALRWRWLRELFPELHVVHITEELPQEPAEHPDFWAIWRRVCQQALPEPADLVFASEDYGWTLAEVLGARYLPVDHARALVPISGTAIRADPLGHWDLLPEPVRPWFLRRACLFGPESTGKSTLAADLARHFGTRHVAEYARGLLDFKGGRCDAADIPLIVRGQIASEEALARQARRVLFCDTDPLTTSIWSRWLFGDCPAWILETASQRRYDLTLLLDVDVPWVDDRQRRLGHRRRAFFADCQATLEAHGRPYRIIRGDWENRFRLAREAVEELLAAPARTGAGAT